MSYPVRGHPMVEDVVFGWQQGMSTRALAARCGRSVEWVRRTLRAAGVDTAVRRPPVAELLAARSRRDGECTVWTGATSSNGYPQLTVAGRVRLVRRAWPGRYITGRCRRRGQWSPPPANGCCVSTSSICAQSPSSTDLP